MKRLWILLLIAGIAIVAVSAFQYFSRPGRGDVAPGFVLSTVDSKEIALDGYRGRPVMLHFFATWCGMCVDEFPTIVRLQNDFEQLGLVILAISEDDATSYGVVREFSDAMQPKFPILLDMNGKVADSYQSWAVPETILVGKDGKIAWRHAGPVNWDEESVRKKVGEFIQK